MFIDIITIAWGKEYIDKYFNNLIPSINNNNLENFDKIFNINLVIPYNDEQYLEVFKDLITKCKINIICKEQNKTSAKNKYIEFSEFIEFGIGKLSLDYFIPLYPDMVISKNFFKEIYNYFNKENYDIIFLPCPRTNLDNSIFDKTHDDWNSEIKLTSYILNNCHTKMDYLTWNSKFYNNSPAWLIFKFKKSQLYYCFHMTPLLIKKSILQNKSINESFDTYVSAQYFNYSYLVINNSKNICWLSYENSIIPENNFKNNRNLLKSFIAFKIINNKNQQKLGYNSFFLSNDNKSIYINYIDKLIVAFLKISLTIFSYFYKILRFFLK